MGLRETKTPDIPAPGAAVPAWARDFWERVRETLQVREGRRGDQLDQAVTYRDLAAGGLASFRGIGQVGGRAGGLAFTPIVGSEDPDLTPPPLLTGLKATPGLKTIFVQWDAPLYQQGHGPAHVEVWGAPYSGTGPLPTFGNAALLDRVQGVLYPHQVQHASTWHYWARNVTVDGVAQPTPTGGTNGVSATAGLDIEAALTDLTGQITESQLYAALASRISLIDGPATLAGSVDARLQTEATVRLNSDSALASSISTVSSAVGNAVVALQEEATARATADGALFAQWTVKIDAAGRVSGIGLASEPVEAGGSTSAFGVRADRFWVAAPNDYTQEAAPGAPAAGQTWFQPSTKLTKRWDGAAWQAFEPIVPFTVQTTPFTESGRTLPAGVYMDAVYIRNLSALIARFGDASIDNALIASLDAAKLTAGDGTIGGTLKSQNYIAGSQGWRVHRDGSAEFGFAHIRGTLTADRINGYNLRVMSGGYSAYAWPAAGQSGFYLGPEGLLLGNANNGRYLQVTADGQLYAPGFSIENGIARLGWGGLIGRPADNELLNSYQALGQNLIPNSDISTSLTWGAFYFPGSGATWSIGLNYASAYWSSGYTLGLGTTRNAVIHQNNNSGGGDTQAVADVYPFGNTGAASGWNRDNSVPVVPGTRYCFSYYGASHRCNIGGGLYFFDEGDNVLAAPEIVIQGPTNGNADRLSVYARPNVIATAPAGAAYARAYIRKYNTLSGHGDSYMWMAAPSFEAVGADATGPGPYNPGPTGSVRQIGYTGDLNATNGAPAGTYVGSIPAASVESQAGAQARADAAYTNSVNAAAVAAQAAADLARINANAYADGIVTAEEARAIADATAKANAAEANAKAAAAIDAQARADLAYTNAVSVANSGLATKLANNARNVLSGAGGFVAGDLTWDGAGNRTGGNGVAMTAQGLVAYKSGAPTFALTASGDSSFAGALSAATGTFSGALTADAVGAVNTINLAGESVTVPRAAYTAARLAVATNTQAQSVAIDTHGQRVTLQFGCSTDMQNVMAGATINFSFVLKRDGVTLQTWLHSVAEGGAVTTATMPPYVDQPAAGSHTYSVECTATGLGGSPGISSRGLLAMEVQR